MHNEGHMFVYKYSYVAHVVKDKRAHTNRTTAGIIKVVLLFCNRSLRGNNTLPTTGGIFRLV